MVSSGQITSDAGTFSSNISSYSSSVSSLAGSWQGKSYDNFNSETSNFISEFQSTIESQMSSLASAVSDYEEYKTARQNKEITESNLATARNANDSSAIAKYSTDLETYTNRMSSYKSKIETALENIKGQKLEATPLKNNNEFVNYYQYNYSEPYSEGSIATSGCGPTSLAMVLTYLLGEEVSPVETAELGNGDYTCSAGTCWDYFGDMADRYGVNCEQMGISEDNIVNNLENGETLIMSMGPGHFTSGGHFIVLRGIDENNNIIVSDPASEDRSNQTWDLDVFLDEGTQIWAFDNK